MPETTRTAPGVRACRTGALGESGARLSRAAYRAEDGEGGECAEGGHHRADQPRMTGVRGPQHGRHDQTDERADRPDDDRLPPSFGATTTMVVVGKIGSAVRTSRHVHQRPGERADSARGLTMSTIMPDRA